MSRVRMVLAALAVLAAVAVAAVALAGGEDGGPARPGGTVVSIDDVSVRAEVAADQASRQRGLSGRERLAYDAGMLFLLPNDAPIFWMKGMRFPLDIVWIKEGRVVDVTADAPPPDGQSPSLPTYSPDRPADRALEVNAGWAARHDVRRGDVVRVLGAGP